MTYVMIYTKVSKTYPMSVQYALTPPPDKDNISGLQPAIVTIKVAL